MKTTADRQASAKRAWDTMRQRKAAGLPPLSAEKAAPKPEKDYSGLIGAWLTPGPEVVPVAADPEPVAKPKRTRKAKAVVAKKKTVKRLARKQAA